MHAPETNVELNKELVRTLYEDCINMRALGRLDELIAPDFVGARWTFRATHRRRFAGLPPSHADVTQEGNVIYQLREGRIVRAWLQADRLGVLQQIGAIARAFAESRGDRPL